MVDWFADEGLVTDSPPIVAAQENAGNPHYAPTPTDSRPIQPNEVLLLDLWGKLRQARARSTPTSPGRALPATPPAEVADVPSA